MRNFASQIVKLTRSRIYPLPLNVGDHVRIIAPSRSLGFISADLIALAQHTFARLGLRISFGANVSERDQFDSSPVDARLNDLHAAIQDPSVNAIFSAIGGYNSNQLLDGIDFSLFQRHPKIVCGYSDITVLTNAIYAKTGLVTYSGPHFATLGMIKGADYIISYLQKCLLSKAPYTIEPSPRWSDDLWFEDQERRVFQPNPGFWIINAPVNYTVGTSLGGHISSFTSLHGTQFMPDLTDAVLFLEATGDTNPQAFDRLLQSIILLPGFCGVRALCLGRFQNATKMTFPILSEIVHKKSALAGIPVIANLDFGHTEPIITFPIGGEVTIETFELGPKITVVKH